MLCFGPKCGSACQIGLKQPGFKLFIGSNRLKLPGHNYHLPHTANLHGTHYRALRTNSYGSHFEFKCRPGSDSLDCQLIFTSLGVSLRCTVYGTDPGISANLVNYLSRTAKHNELYVQYMGSVNIIVALTHPHLHDEQLNLWLAMAVPLPCHICGCVSVFSYFDNFHWPQGRCQLAFPSLHLSCTGDGIGTNARDCCRLCRSVHVLGINRAPGEGGMKMHYW